MYHYYNINKTLYLLKQILSTLQTKLILYYKTGLVYNTLLKQNTLKD